MFSDQLRGERERHTGKEDVGPKGCMFSWVQDIEREDYVSLALWDFSTLFLNIYPQVLFSINDKTSINTYM